MYVRVNDNPIPYDRSMFSSVNSAGYMPQLSGSKSKMLMWVVALVLLIVGVSLIVSHSKKKSSAKVENVPY